MLKSLRCYVWITMALIMTGCASSPPSQYYTLLPAQGDGAALMATGAASDGAYAVSVQRVAVPGQVDRPQIVLSKENGAGVQLLNQSLWAAPLGDELRSALSSELTTRLGVLDVAMSDAPTGLPIWTVSLHMQRFDSLYNQMVVQEATWRLAPLNLPAAPQLRVCRAQAWTPVSDGIPGLVRGHQTALKSIAALIAAQIAGRALPVDSNVVFKGCIES